MTNSVLINMREKRTTLLEYILVLLGCTIVFSTASIMGDECDWTGSGLGTPTTRRGVTPVYLRCTSGRITWLYPKGALRVLLRFPGGERDFRACIKIHHNQNKKNAARLFLEGPRSLLPLYAHNDGSSPKSIRCFNSKNGQAAIYVEATEHNNIDKIVSDIEYDLQPLPRGVHGYDPTEECRPCTTEELAQAFCTSDLVTRGTIYGVENTDDLEMSKLSIKVTKLIRHTVDDSLDEEIDTNFIFSNDKNSLKEITLYIAQHCEVSHGVGEFVFMARKKLGNLTLKCAPRLEDWAFMITKLTEEGKAHCLLSS